MYLTTANIRKHIQEVNNYNLDMEATIDALYDGESWLIRIVPFDGLSKYQEEARLLYIGSGKKMKAKRLKSKKAIYNLADRYGIEHSKVTFGMYSP